MTEEQIYTNILKNIAGYTFNNIHLGKTHLSVYESWINGSYELAKNSLLNTGYNWDASYSFNGALTKSHENMVYSIIRKDNEIRVYTRTEKDEEITRLSWKLMDSGYTFNKMEKDKWIWTGGNAETAKEKLSEIGYLLVNGNMSKVKNNNSYTVSFEDSTAVTFF